MFIQRFWNAVCSIRLAAAGAIVLSCATQPESLQAVELTKLDQVLADEASGKPVNRRQILAQESGDVSQWQSGRVLVDGQWMDMESLQEHKLAPQIAEYRERRDRQELDVEGHRRLAKWCTGHQLPEMAAVHWKAVATTAIDDEEAHRALGHKRIDQGWFSSEELNRAAQEHKHQKSALKLWMPQVRVIVRQMQSESSETKLEGLQKLNSIDTEDAVSALQFAIVQVDTPTALPLLAKIKSIRSKRSCLALCEIALIDPTSEIGRSAVEGLFSYDPHFYVPDLLQMLEMPVKLSEQRMYMPNGAILIRKAFLRENMTEKEQVEVAKLVVMQTSSLGKLHRSQMGFTFEEARGVEKTLGGLLFTFQSPVHPQAIQSIEKLTEFELRKARLDTSTWDTAKRDSEHQVRAILSLISGLPADAPANQFWTWWPQLNETYQSYNKPTTRKYITEDTTYINLPTEVTVNFTSCLVAGTPIQTADGARDVDKLKVGMSVPSIDISTGEVSFKPIVQVSQRTADPVYTISLSGGDSIKATGGHKWWVVGKGWLRSRELQAGQFIRTGDSSIEIKAVDKSEESTKVYNLVVDDNHTYFVGKNRLLSWDVTTLQPTLQSVPGQSKPTYVSTTK